MTTPPPDPGSFRDPLSRVFVDDGRVLRGLTPQAAHDFAAVRSTRFFDAAIDRGQIVATTMLGDGTPDTPAPTLGDAYAEVLEHPRLDVWTYPFEWSFSMLQDAARLQLTLQRDALAEGISSKDATPYNVQFDGARAVFVDVGSFEPYEEGDPWFGYLQFCQLFLYPLLVQAYAEVPFQPLLRGSLEGINPEVAWRLLGASSLVRKGVPIHVALHARAQRRFADSTVDVRGELKRSGYKRSLVEANVKGLLHLVEKLQWKRAESTWSQYGGRSHYTPGELNTKEQFVREAAGRSHRRLAWDIGCNDGRFSRLIADDAEHVVAFDSDHLVVDMLYRALRTEQSTNITPLVVDLADPPPALGWAGRERPGFLDRCRPDFVVALAVIHHLAITANVPTSAFLDLIRSFDCDAVIEFPTEHDPMVQRLLRNKRAGIHEGYNLAAFEQQLGERFTIRRREALETRALFELNPR